MEQARLVSVNRDCLETRPCKHECTLEIGTCSVTKHMTANKIVEFWDDLPRKTQKHFQDVCNKPLKPLEDYPENKDTYHDLVEDVLYLSSKYTERMNKAFEEAKNALETTDLKAKLFKALKKGYCGFEVYVNPFIVNFTSEQLRELEELAETKTREAGLALNEEEKIIKLSFGNGYLTFLLESKLIYKFLPKNTKIAIHQRLSKLETNSGPQLNTNTGGGWR